MAPSFLRDSWRRSTSSFRKSERSTDSSTNGSGVITQTSSTANSANGGITPPLEGSSFETSISASDPHTLANLPAPVRPTVSTSSTNRYSVSGMSGLGSPAPQSYTSPYAPRIENATNNSTVHQKVMLIWGRVGDVSTPALDGQIMVSRQDDAFPSVPWPVCESSFKALVYLQPGPNVFRLDFTSPKLANNSLSNPIHSTTINIYMVQPLGAPPLQLVILLAKNSPATFDATPARIEKEGNGLDTAIQKYRMAAYLWQAFTAEQIHRGRLGRRAFRMEEEWTNGSSNYRDRQNGAMRSEAKVHVVRCERTVEELRDIELAQQNSNGSQRGNLIDIAHQAMKDYFNPLPNQKQYCAVLFLDTQWDKNANMIRGHAALGCVYDDIALAIFGSHALHSYPSTFEEVVPAFTDCTPTDTNYVANDCNESGSSWEAANIGIGAHLHEVGHLFGCPHQEYGVMRRDYVTFSRTFLTREPYSTRTKAKGGLVLAKDECVWHRLDLLRFRCHPCFAIPLDRQRLGDDSISAWPVEKGNVIVTAASGVLFLEVFVDGYDDCLYFMEYNTDANGNAPKQLTLTEQALRTGLAEQLLRRRLPDAPPTSNLKVSIKSRAGGNIDIADFSLLASKASKIKLSNGRSGFRSIKVGLSQMEGSTPEEVVFHSVVQQTKLLTQVRVYHGNSVDGLEFIYEDSTSQLFGRKGGLPGGSEFNLDTRKCEVITGFVVRSGFWIDAIAIMTSLGRQSPMYGSSSGSLHRMIPPIGYSIAGITGSCAAWVDGFGVLITR